jgi:hypothetical protein
LCEEEKEIIRKKLQLKQIDYENYSINPFSSNFKKSENLLQDVTNVMVNKKFRLLGGMFEEAFMMEEQFDG